MTALEGNAGASPIVTRGVLVDGRCGSVDILENMLSLGQQEAILRATLDAARLVDGDRLVDVGCGTGKLPVFAAMVGQGRLGDVLGIDATAGMIDLARKRAAEAGVAARFEVGVGESLPLADGSVDAATSSYFLHHLPEDVKVKAVQEMWRVLAPGGRLVITDYGRPRSLAGYVASFPMRFNFYEYVRPQLTGQLDRILAAQGLGPVDVVEVFLGYIAVLRVTKPA